MHGFRAHLHQASGSTLQWRLRFCSHWKQWSRSRMGLQPIFKRLHWFQWEQNRKRHRRVVAALTLTLGVNGPLKCSFSVHLEFLAGSTISQSSTHSHWGSRSLEDKCDADACLHVSVGVPPVLHAASHWYPRDCARNGPGFLCSTLPCTSTWREARNTSTLSLKHREILSLSFRKDVSAWQIFFKENFATTTGQHFLNFSKIWSWCPPASEFLLRLCGHWLVKVRLVSN